MLTPPRIYVASLSDYNAGRLVGVWIDATLGVDHIHDQVQKMLAESPEPGAEEWAIHDHENFAPWQPSEWESLENIAAVGAAAMQHGPALLAFVAHDPTILDDPAEMGTVGDAFACCFQGTYDDLADYARERLDDSELLTAAPGSIAERYFDYAAYGRDLQLSGAVWTEPAPDLQVWVFLP